MVALVITALQHRRWRCHDGAAPPTAAPPATAAPSTAAPHGRSPSRTSATTCRPARTATCWRRSAPRARSRCRPIRHIRHSQSSLLTIRSGYKGFDIDVGHEIANRLGVDIAFETPAWEVITAGSWNGRWDFSVGSMTITSARQEILDFTEPYYYTPAQMTVKSDSTITDLDGLAGKVICVGASTTYLDWINGTLDFGRSRRRRRRPKDRPQPRCRPTAIARSRGRPAATTSTAGSSSSTTVEGAIDDGLPVKAVGDPVFFEPLAVAFDKSAPTTMHSSPRSTRSWLTCTRTARSRPVHQVVRRRSARSQTEQ